MDPPARSGSCPPYIYPYASYMVDMTCHRDLLVTMSRIVNPKVRNISCTGILYLGIRERLVYFCIWGLEMRTVTDACHVDNVTGMCCIWGLERESANRVLYLGIRDENRDRYTPHGQCFLSVSGD